MATPADNGNGRNAAARFLVAGTAIAETVIHHPGGERREGLGGVAATIALALAGAGNPVTLVTNVGRGPAGRRAEELLADTPIRVLAGRSRSPAGHAAIFTHRGEQRQTSGRWPRQYGLSKTVMREAADHDCIIADCNMDPEELARILDQPGKADDGERDHHPRLRPAPEGKAEEAGDAHGERGRGMGDEERDRHLPDGRADAGAERPGHAPHPGSGRLGAAPRGGRETLRSPAVETPANTDFVGCGDYAAAGAVHSLVHGLDPAATINGFIRRKLEANAATRKRERR